MIILWLFRLAAPFFLILALCAPACPQNTVDWTKGQITVIGQGTVVPTGNRISDRLNAERAAEVKAQRALLEIIKGLRIDSQTTVYNLMLKEDMIKTRMAGIVHGAKIISKKVEWEDAIPLATIEMQICLNNAECNGPSLAKSLNLDQSAGPANAPKKEYQTDLQDNTGSRAPRYSCDFKRKVTGVIFNLEGRQFEKELLPVVITRKGNDSFTVYSVKSVKPNITRTYGVVRYAESVDHGKTIPYLGDNILVIAVDQVTKDNFIMIDRDSARILRETLAHDNDYTSEARVVIAER